MNPADAVPADHVLVRTTPEFDEQHLPSAILAAHRTGPGLWGNLVIREGGASFVFEDELDQLHVLVRGDSIAIAPQRPHHVVITGPVRFVIEFYRQRDT